MGKKTNLAIPLLLFRQTFLSNVLTNVLQMSQILPMQHPPLWQQKLWYTVYTKFKPYPLCHYQSHCPHCQISLAAVQYHVVFEAPLLRQGLDQDRTDHLLVLCKKWELSGIVLSVN
jgi:hypothetical protein